MKILKLISMIILIPVLCSVTHLIHASKDKELKKAYELREGKKVTRFLEKGKDVFVIEGGKLRIPTKKEIKKFMKVKQEEKRFIEEMKRAEQEKKRLKEEMKRVKQEEKRLREEMKRVKEEAERLKKIHDP